MHNAPANSVDHLTGFWRPNILTDPVNDNHESMMMHKAMNYKQTTPSHTTFPILHRFLQPEEKE